MKATTVSITLLLTGYIAIFAVKYITVARQPTISMSKEQTEEALSEIRDFLDEAGMADMFDTIEILDAGKRLELRTNDTWHDMSQRQKETLIAALGNMYYLLLCEKEVTPTCDGSYIPAVAIYDLSGSQVAFASAWGARVLN